MTKEFRPRLTEDEYFAVQKMRESKVRNTLIIGDLHEPFCLDSYLEFCIEQKIKYNCTEIVFIGDIIDSHFSSFHEIDPDGMSAGDELEIAVKKINKWYEAFPEAYVTVGNHDRIIMRKAFSAGISKRWIKDYKDVLETPNWKFVDHVEIDDVVYVHGEAGTAKTRMMQEMRSVVQGHLHTEAYIHWNVGAKYKAFAMQVGCGINHKSYAMAYAKAGKKPAIGCGVVLENGKLPISILMDL